MEPIENSKATQSAFFTSLYNQHFTFMYRYALSILHDHYAAEDVVHDAFLKLFSYYQVLPTLSRPQLRLYLKKTVHSMACRYIHKQAGIVYDPFDHDNYVLNYCPDFDSMAMAPAEAAWQDLFPYIILLPTKEQQLIYEKYALCLPIRLLAKRHGARPGALRQTLLRARRRMRSKIGNALLTRKQH